MIYSTKKSVAIFGDVHGASDKLKKLLKVLDTDYPGIKIFSTGDLVDKGPDSKGVVDLCIKRKITAVIGNHDDAFRLFLNKDIGAIHIHLHDGMGGKATMHSYSNNTIIKSGTRVDLISKEYLKVVPESHKKYFDNMPLYIILEFPKEKYTESYLLSHGALSQQSYEEWKADNYDDFIADDPYKNIDRMMNDNRDEILWQHKTRGWAEPYNMTQIMGHVPMPDAVISDDIIALDTGCGKRNDAKLSCLILPEKKLIEIL